MKCWECCWAGRDTHYVNHLTEANVQHQDPLLNALKSVRSHAFVHLFVPCQPETAVLSSRFHCMVLILFLFLLPLAMAEIKTLWAISSFSEYTQSCLSLRTTNSLCLHCGNSPQMLVGGFIFLLCEIEHGGVTVAHQYGLGRALSFYSSCQQCRHGSPE